MNNERLGELVGASVASGVPPTAEAIAGVLSDQERLDGVSNEAILATVAERGLLVGAAAVSKAAQAETIIAETTEIPVMDVLSTLTPEQQERATALQTAMAEKFSTKETPLTSEDFGVVLVGKGDEQTSVVMLTSGNGLYKGSWSKIMDRWLYCSIHA